MAPLLLPPARAYPLNRFLFALKSDDAARARYLADPETTMREAGLEAEAPAALAPARPRPPGGLRRASLPRLHGGPALAHGPRALLLRAVLITWGAPGAPNPRARRAPAQPGRSSISRALGGLTIRSRGPTTTCERWARLDSLHTLGPVRPNRAAKRMRGLDGQEFSPAQHGQPRSRGDPSGSSSRHPRFTTHRRGRPSASSSTTSTGMSRIVVVTGRHRDCAAHADSAASRLSSTTGRRPDGGGRCAHQTSPRAPTSVLGQPARPGFARPSLPTTRSSGRARYAASYWRSRASSARALRRNAHASLMNAARLSATRPARGIDAREKVVLDGDLDDRSSSIASPWIAAHFAPCPSSCVMRQHSYYTLRINNEINNRHQRCHRPRCAGRLSPLALPPAEVPVVPSRACVRRGCSWWDRPTSITSSPRRACPRPGRR